MYMGAVYRIPAFWVPALLVTHYLTFVNLRRWKGADRDGIAVSPLRSALRT